MRTITGKKKTLQLLKRACKLRLFNEKKQEKKNILITMRKRDAMRRNFVSAPDRCKP